MIGLLSVIAFAVALVCHLVHVDAFIVQGFTLLGLVLLALVHVTSWVPWRSHPRP